MSHQIVRENRRQSISITPNSGKKADWNDLYPDTMLDELWELVQYIGVPGRYHVQRKGAPGVGANGKIGVRILTVNETDHVIFFAFQAEMKGPRSKFTVEPPNPDPGKGIPEITNIHGRLKDLSERRDRKGNLALPEPEPVTAPPSHDPVVDSSPAPDPQPTPPVSQPVSTPAPAPSVPKVEINWENERLHQTFMRLLRELDSGYSEGWIPIKDMMSVVECALEECGMEIPDKLDGRTTKRLFTALVDKELLERTGSLHAVKYRECRRKSLTLSGDLLADAARLKEMAARFEELDGSIRRVTDELDPLLEERDSLTTRLAELQEEIGKREQHIEAAQREIEAERLDEAADMRRQLLQQLQG